MTTINDVFDPARNSLNAIRLLLAAAVIVSHSSLVNGLGSPPMLGGTDVGLAAVAGFFGISGYLVLESRLREKSLLAYLKRRFLRIYPGFIVALIVVAFVFAPLSTLATPQTKIIWSSAFSYVWSNAGLFIHQLNVENTLANNAFPFVWNIPLWTLFYEALCYLAIGLLVSVVPRRVIGVALGALLTAATLASLFYAIHSGAIVSPVLRNAANLSSFFLAGGLLYVCRSRVVSRAYLAALSAGLVVILAAAGVFAPLAAIPVVYCVFYVASNTPFLYRVGRRNDISYGMYVYGFPVQQVLVLFLGGVVLPTWLFSIVAVAATIPFAWASWLAVERPALTLKRASAMASKAHE